MIMEVLILSEKREDESLMQEQVELNGELNLDENTYGYNIHLLNIIGEIEGH